MKNRLMMKELEDALKEAQMLEMGREAPDSDNIWMTAMRLFRQYEKTLQES